MIDQKKVEEIVSLPDGVDFQENVDPVKLYYLLIGKPEERNPIAYAEIFEEAAKHPKASEWMRFACIGEGLNGRRRAKGADHADIEGRFVSLSGDAGKLPESVAKQSLLAGNWYNVGILRRNLRRYSESADAQRTSSSHYGLAGNVVRHLMGLFVAEVEEVSASFASSDDDLIRKRIRAMVSARNYVLDSLEEYPVWMQNNACVHISFAVAMTEFRGMKGVASKDYATDFRAARGSSMAHWAKAFAVYEDYRRGRYEKVTKAVPVDLPSSSLDNANLMVQITVAYAERKLQHRERAEGRLRAVANHTGPNGGIPIAVATASLQ
ncbi:hypothetical protein A3B18_02725 [Candidatus Giovannonibacteria bacterium RIFCSPLOWO2_01_FULL_46_13]|uniref:Uncharacterized protein n=1 Tax=Candidatus Giovannonibacteria bacterium RIFCSPLOWO2_01_FULL_46_13 TaxID=1798352 RepID=A0A1F5X2T8_9BACT|nr:MAG: hypothetical protein A3B18_02725 [Candidatus Giovannonibacteria bacterium RIFCSPLOWO2_01_FULL_46_13]